MRRPSISNVCAYCGLVGHYPSNCHVQARKATRPDEADIKAQELVNNLHNGSIGSVRKAVAKAIREARR